MIITNLDVILFYLDKEEHYPISDDFVKGYQQKDKGYIDVAANEGLLIDKSVAEPNQKWHLLVSYYLLNIKNNDLKYINQENSCTQLKCPELLLWMAEAAGVDPDIVKTGSFFAKEKIDDIRKKSPNSAYSKLAKEAMNDNLRIKYKRSLWYFIQEKIMEWKISENKSESISNRNINIT